MRLLKKLSLFTVLLTVGSGSMIHAGQEANPKPPMYRLVYSKIPKPGDFRSFFYAVSVDHWLDLQNMRDVVCHVVDVEKPTNYRSLAIHIYFNLDKYPEWFADGGPGFVDPGQKQLAERSISNYDWNVVDFPEKLTRLMIVRDTRGEAFSTPRSENFDHTKDCSGKP